MSLKATPVVNDDRSGILLVPMTQNGLADWSTDQKSHVIRWLQSTAFTAEEGDFVLVPDQKGQLEKVLVGVGQSAFNSLGGLPRKLPPGDYRLSLEADLDWSDSEKYLALLGFLLGSYRFDHYRKSAGEDRLTLLVPDESTREALCRETTAVSLVRDLINTPTEDMMPEDLASQSNRLAQEFDAEFSQVVGDALLSENYPMIHAVGRAAKSCPRLIELNWGSDKNPHVILVGKGVCFDTGGLNLKPSRGIRLMKKDMGGAASVLGLASLIMANALPVRLTVLIPAAENSVAGNSYRPGDVFITRRGCSVEIDDTDAEGRLLLADALTYACEKSPDMILDFATLTGAARVALGTEIAAMFTNRDDLAAALAAAATQVADPVWRLPLYSPYQSLLKSQIADSGNSGDSPYAGAITAALFLLRFIDKEIPWVHYDLMAWNVNARPTGPIGGEAMAVRATYHFLQQKYGRH